MVVNAFYALSLPWLPASSWRRHAELQTQRYHLQFHDLRKVHDVPLVGPMDLQRPDLMHAIILYWHMNRLIVRTKHEWEMARALSMPGVYVEKC